MHLIKALPISPGDAKQHVYVVDAPDFSPGVHAREIAHRDVADVPFPTDAALKDAQYLGLFALAVMRESISLDVSFGLGCVGYLAATRSLGARCRDDAMPARDPFFRVARNVKFSFR